LIIQFKRPKESRPRDLSLDTIWGLINVLIWQFVIIKTITRWILLRKHLLKTILCESWSGKKTRNNIMFTDGRRCWDNSGMAQMFQSRSILLWLAEIFYQSNYLHGTFCFCLQNDFHMCTALKNEPDCRNCQLAPTLKRHLNSLRILTLTLRYCKVHSHLRSNSPSSYVRETSSTNESKHNLTTSSTNI
jgi:hypothetical protein